MDPIMLGSVALALAILACALVGWALESAVVDRPPAVVEWPLTPICYSCQDAMRKRGAGLGPVVIRTTLDDCRECGLATRWAARVTL